MSKAVLILDLGNLTAKEWKQLWQQCGVWVTKVKDDEQMEKIKKAIDFITEEKDERKEFTER